MNEKLQDKVAVITRGTSGTGLATARLFVEDGAFVFILGLRQKELDEAVDSIGRDVRVKFEKPGGGATGTIRPSTSPRMPTSGFEVRGTYGSVRPLTSIQGCSEYDRRGRHGGSCCRVHRRPPALLSRLLSKW